MTRTRPASGPRSVPTLRLGAAGLLLVASHAAAETFAVGPGRAFDRIEAAYAHAAAGDVIEVYPRAADEPYAQVALKVALPRLTIRAVPADGDRVALSGQGYDYSGAGPVPRAVFQFGRGADGCALEGFEISGAHNDSHNGAGVRIDQANQVVVRDCDIHDNDMGIMSNGDGTLTTAVGQLVEHCRIHHNGDPRDPGYSHNLYLGGTSAVLSFCEVHSSLTGHNVKSRAHQTWVEYCYVHDSANREFDLVDDAVTARPGSHAVLVGNQIVKAVGMDGNREVLHFGQDLGGPHRGDLVLIHNTILTPYDAPVIYLSAPTAAVHLVGNILYDDGAGPAAADLVRVRGDAVAAGLSGSHNWFAAGYAAAVAGSGLGTVAAPGTRLPFVDPAAGDYRLARAVADLVDAGPPADRLQLPAMGRVEDAGADDRRAALLQWQYRHPAGRMPRPRGAADVGAGQCAAPCLR